MGCLFSMYTPVNKYMVILSYSSRATNNCLMVTCNPNGDLLNVLDCLLLYLESNQVNVLWKLSKNNKTDQQPNFLLSLLNLLELYLHLKKFLVIFSTYRFQTKQISNLEMLSVTTSNETSNSTSCVKLCPKTDLGF